MDSYIATVLLGIVCVIIGITNMRGNISTIHSYHRRRVSEEDIPAFGKLAGLGTVIAGGGLTLYGILNFAAAKSGYESLIFAGTVVLIGGIVAGIGLSLYAIVKYNKGLF